MRSFLLSTLAGLALLGLGGCMTLKADVPPDAVRRHMAEEKGVEIGAICSHADQAYSEGARICMTGRRMVCDPTARWIADGECQASGGA